MTKGRRHTPGQSGGTAQSEEGAVNNGLSQALGFGQGIGGGNAPFGLFGGGNPAMETIEGAGTIFKNLRYHLVSNFRQMISQAYAEIGLIQTIVDVPVDDAMKGGVEIKSKQLDEDQLAQLLVTMDRENDLNVVAQTAKWNRLFGGAATLTLTDQDPEEPLDVGAIEEESPLDFRAIDMWEMYGDLQLEEGHDAQIVDEPGTEHYNYYGVQVHKSRLMRMRGKEAPSFIRPRLRGWGLSVVEILVRSINQYLKATDLGFEVLDEFKLDVFKLKGLVNTLLAPGGTQKVMERVQLANWEKNYNNAVVLDSEDEFDHKQLSFAGLAEAMMGIRLQVASDLRMPLTKIFGISATGFNSGEDDIEVYNSMVESTVRHKIKYDVLRVAELRCQQLFGFVPDDLAVSFKPLRELSAEQQENVKTQKFTRLLQAKQAGEITTLEFRDACNRGQLFDVTLDTAEDKLNPDDPEIEDVMAGKEAEEDEEAMGGKDAKAAPKGKKSTQEAKQTKNSGTGAVYYMPRRFFRRAVAK